MGPALGRHWLPPPPPPSLCRALLDLSSVSWGPEAGAAQGLRPMGWASLSLSPLPMDWTGCPSRWERWPVIGVEASTVSRAENLCPSPLSPPSSRPSLGRPRWGGKDVPLSSGLHAPWPSLHCCPGLGKNVEGPGAAPTDSQGALGTVNFRGASWGVLTPAKVVVDLQSQFPGGRGAVGARGETRPGRYGGRPALPRPTGLGGEAFPLLSPLTVSWPSPRRWGRPTRQASLRAGGRKGPGGHWEP